VSQVSSEARVHIGREESVKGTLRNQRLGRIPAEPDSLQDLIIDGESAQTSEHNPQHLIYDNVPDTDSQIIVFGASDALKHLSTANTWYMDGNRAVAPRGFCQLYIIRCLLGNTVVSAIYALLKRVTRYLREPDMCHCWQVFRASARTWSSDCGDRLWKCYDLSFNSCIGDHIAVQGCFYHLTQSNWRKIAVWSISTKTLMLSNCFVAWWTH